MIEPIIAKIIAAARRIALNTGWSDAEAAGGILACAIDNAAQCLGTDAVADLLKLHLYGVPQD